MRRAKQKISPRQSSNFSLVRADKIRRNLRSLLLVRGAKTLAQSATCCASPVAGILLNASFRLEGTTGAKSSPIPNGESAKQTPIPRTSKSTAVSLVSANPHLTPLQAAAGCCVSSPSPSPSAEDLETPPLAHVTKGEREEDSESENLTALLARVSRPPPFPFGGDDRNNGGGGGAEEEEEEEEEEQEREERERERELPEPANAGNDDEASGSSSIQAALSSLALVEEA